MNAKTILASALAAAVVASMPSGAFAAAHSFTNASGGSAADSANWLNGSVPADSDASASVAFTNLTAGATATLADTDHAWKELLVSHGTVEGGSIALDDGIKASAKGGVTTVASKLSGESVTYVHGAKVNLTATQVDDIAAGVRNGTLVLDGALTSGSTLHLDGNGVVEIAQNQSVATLEGDCKGGRLQIDYGKTLTLTGVGATASTEFGGNLYGAGTLVKQGADYALTFTGDNTTNHPFTGTIDIRAGSLALSDGKTRAYAVQPTMYWSFDDASNPGNADVGSVSLKAWTWDSSHVASDANISAPGVNGTGIHPNGTVFMGVNQGSAPRGNANFSVILWAKADPATSGRVQLLGWGDRVITVTQFAVTMEADGGIAVFDSYQLPSDHKILSAGSETNLKDGRWHCIAVTFNGTTLTAYIDGSSAGSVEKTFNMKNGYAYLDLGITGAGDGGSRTVCDVWLDEVAVYTGTALTADQVSACHTSFSAIPEAQPAEATLPDPIAWYRFDDATNVGKDSSGNGYDLTIVDNKSSGTKPSNATAPVVAAGSPIHGGMYSSTKYGYLRWGGGSGGTLPAKMPKGSGSPITVSLWVNASGSSPIVGSTSYNATMFQLGTGNASQRLSIRYSDAYRRFNFLTGKNTGWNVSSGSSSGDAAFVNAEPLDVTGWHHVAYSFDGSTYSLYVDGRLQGTGTKSVTIADDGMLLVGVDGDATTKNSTLFAGYMDEVKIYDSALSAAQIAADYRKELPRTGGVVDPAASVALAAGATLALDGVEQTLENAPSGVGTIRLAHGAALTLAPQSDVTLSAALAGAGTLRISGGAEVTLAGAVGRGVSVVAEGAALATAQSAAFDGGAVVVGDGASLSTASDICADVVFDSGSTLKMGETVAVDGTVTLQSGFTVDASAAEPGWATLVTADAFDATGVDLDAVAFTGVTGSSDCRLRIVNGALQAKVSDAATVLTLR